MMNYLCENCGALFDEPECKCWRESHGEGIVEDWEIPVCPVCGDEDFEEIENDVYDEDSL